MKRFCAGRVLALGVQKGAITGLTFLGGFRGWLNRSSVVTLFPLLFGVLCGGGFAARYRQLQHRSPVLQPLGFIL